jgi:RimJ/RimL family protein N-acetyltransferase
MTLADCLAECAAERCFAAYELPAHKEPILDEAGACVGFYAPKMRRGRWCMGFIFIARPYRRQGHALRAVQSFLARYPDTYWSVPPGNQASQCLAKRAGFFYHHTTPDGFDVYSS